MGRKEEAARKAAKAKAKQAAKKDAVVKEDDLENQIGKKARCCP